MLTLGPDGRHQHCAFPLRNATSGRGCAPVRHRSDQRLWCLGAVERALGDTDNHHTAFAPGYQPCFKLKPAFRCRGRTASSKICVYGYRFAVTVPVSAGIRCSTLAFTLSESTPPRCINAHSFNLLHVAIRGISAYSRSIKSLRDQRRNRESIHPLCVLVHNLPWQLDAHLWDLRQRAACIV